MDRDISRYVTIIRQKNGKVKLSHDINNEANIYKLLYELGFRKSKINNRGVYFQKKGYDLIPVEIDDIRHTFYNFLKKNKFKNMPKDITHEDILRWYLEKAPIKQNGLFNYYLEIKLSEREEHIIKLKTDIDYEHKYKVTNLLNKFKEWNFCQSIDTKTHTPLYYKKIDKNKYLIFNHYNFESKKNTDGFDCWIASYKNEKQIGKTIPTEIKDLRFSFDLEKDFELIKKYII